MNLPQLDLHLVDWAHPAAWPGTLQALGVAVLAVVVALVVHALLFRGYARLGRRAPRMLVFEGRLLYHARRPMLLLLPVVALFLVRPFWRPRVGETVAPILSDVLYVLLVAGLAWLAAGVVGVVQDLVERRFDIEAADNLEARRVRTQSTIVRRVVLVFLALLALAAALLRFEGFRELGTGILASAGVAGIILGLAAQRTLGNLLAGIQIAITQPIRVDDVLVVEGEWGRVEEITLTYVVVRIWDLRRLVLPIAYFLEKPFQNWTRTSAKVLGSTYLRVDPRIPFDELRAELERVVGESAWWDRDLVRLHVTDMSEKTVEVRALMSAGDSSKAWELRCEVREKLIGWLQREHPESLPLLRVEGATEPGRGEGREQDREEGREEATGGRGEAAGGAAGTPGRTGRDRSDAAAEPPVDTPPRPGGNRHGEGEPDRVG